MYVDEDPDPVMQPSGTPTHPIDISSSSASYAGSPYHGLDEWVEWWGRYKWEFTPSYHNTPPPPPPEEPYLQAVTPPPPPVEEQPPPPPRRRRNVRMSVCGVPRISSPPITQLPSIPEDPQNGRTLKCYTDD
ncbi:extensin-2-like [Helianthus annuus]|uniref:extensin-2-like n=1 Tax=Helianthus annuus TaxID=4232 RepID=UPI000B90459A|nr:extensin-2-like [Helianthus annuus]